MNLLLGALVLHERLDLLVFASLGLILFGVVLVQDRPRRTFSILPQRQDSDPS